MTYHESLFLPIIVALTSPSTACASCVTAVIVEVVDLTKAPSNIPVDEGIGKTGSTSSEELFLFNSAVKLEAAAEGVVEVNCVVK